VLVPPVAIGFALASLVGIGPPSLPPVPGSEPTSLPALADDATARVIIRCDPADFAALSAELAARWPGAELLEYGTAAFDRVGTRPFVYLEVTGERVADAPQSITLITSDGRAYLRHVTPRDAERARVLAIVGANLLAAVADEDVPPDREQAVVPLPSAEVPARPPTDPVITTTPTEPVRTPPPLPRTAPPVDRRAVPPSSEADRWQLAIDPGATIVLGLAPAGATIFGGALELDVRAPIGLAFGGGLRVLSGTNAGHRLTRVRVAPSIGWIGRAGRARTLEWALALGPVFEPWRVLHGGEVQRLGSHAGRSHSMLYGAALHGALGYRVRLPAAQPVALRIGVRADLAASALATGNAVRALLPRREDPLFALGGVELGLGLDLALWFDLGPARRRRARAAGRADAS
jgi:hypothetical protein